MAKETLNLPRAKLYIVLSVILTFIFLVITFPYEVLIRNYLQSLEKNFGTNITVGSMNIGFIGDSYIDDMVVFLRDGTELDLKDISFNLSLNPITVFIRETVKGKFDIKNIKYVKQDTSFSGLIKCDLFLKLNSKMGMVSEGYINIKIQNVNILGMTIKEFKIPPVQITAVNIETKINKNDMSIVKCIISGSDFRGAISGKINLSKSIMASRLDLKIEIDKNSKILVNYKDLLGMLGPDKDKLFIDVTGSLSYPQTKLPELKQSDTEDNEGKDLKDNKNGKDVKDSKDGEPVKKMPRVPRVPH
jgi:type II secretion system protein N